ncbi:MAG: T9SS type A sorting domain-containing protein, partial [Bacteroidales bacterium]|nr:T9SS type A sorting domain-containing protein [Bacteroidales bacterium]
NVMGQIVYRTEVNGENAVCDVNGLTAGVYFVKIYGNPRTSTGSVSGIVQKFIKE